MCPATVHPRDDLGIEAEAGGGVAAAFRHFRGPADGCGTEGLDEVPVRSSGRVTSRFSVPQGYDLDRFIAAFHAVDDLADGAVAAGGTTMAQAGSSAAWPGQFAMTERVVNTVRTSYCIPPDSP